EYLTKSIQAVEDPSESHRLIAEAYLRMKPPDLRSALRALREQLARALPRTDPKVLAQARLKLGEIHAQLNELEEARRGLGRIASDAPPEVYVAARSQLARSYMAGEAWARAVRHWEQARDTKGAPPAQKGQAQYWLGVCYLRVKRTPEAVAAWEQA